MVNKFDGKWEAKNIMRCAWFLSNCGLRNIFNCLNMTAAVRCRLYFLKIAKVEDRGRGGGSRGPKVGKVRLCSWNMWQWINSCVSRTKETIRWTRYSLTHFLTLLIAGSCVSSILGTIRARSAPLALCSPRSKSPSSALPPLYPCQPPSWLFCSICALSIHLLHSVYIRYNSAALLDAREGGSPLP